ncbi:Sodium/glucose cotransporter [Thalassocella blandensis]|nr:Sodium/glucose cotransporter [Thalassocella blandensis]
MTLSHFDTTVFIIYVVGLLMLALWISRNEDDQGKNTSDYFMASNSLPWWAIGASLIAANISAEQIIGMSGSGYAIGLGIASYEWMAALTLLIVGKYFLPVFLERNIFTMPQFLEQRFDKNVKTIMAVFWLGVYVFVNLTSILWLGALAINTVAGIDIQFAMILLALLSLAYSLYGGLKAVALTDILQVVLLITGGLILVYLSLAEVSNGAGIWQGFQILIHTVPEKFDMVLSKDHPDYIHLPGISVLIGGMWIMNLSYWGFNQYIIQRALAAKNIREAQKGIAFAAYLKLLMPIIVVLPGIAALLIFPQLENSDKAYPSLMSLMPEGLKGLIFAALVAAIVSSISSMSNSISTIFTLDIYSYFKRGQSQHHYVNIGRMASLTGLSCALIVAEPLLGQFDQAFQYIQNFTGFFTPGIACIFILGLFWKRTTSIGALVAALGSFLFSVVFYVFFEEIPFIDRVGYVFLLCFIFAVAASLLTTTAANNKAVNLNDIDFSTTQQFNYATAGVVAILAALYITWW